MVYLALLRAVNVGGTGKVDMRELKTVFETVRMSRVKTYINSGNVIFESDAQDSAALANALEDAIEARFGFRVSVLVRNREEIRSVVEALPDAWKNDSEMKCDVFFLWPSADESSVLDRIDVDPAVDDLRYTPGAILRRVDRNDATRSRLPRLVGTPLYKEMTIRNCNTARKLLVLMDAYE